MRALRRKLLALDNARGGLVGAWWKSDLFVQHFVVRQPGECGRHRLMSSSILVLIVVSSIVA
ncbi:hypothetical protein GQ57_37925 [Burkholderia sp. MSh2]|nr:hypothetical protein GQ57_37925 [Burkholderia sp. MSh2]KFG97967.1 hypothetical protein GQ56_0106690 [Burkholderia paludis]